MTRIDVWDVQAESLGSPIDAGFPRGFDDAFELGAQLGSGGFGIVRVAKERATGLELAVKTIPKRLAVLHFGPAKQAQNLENVKREVQILHRLTACLNVAQLKSVYEDEQSIHILMEWCKGGELTGTAAMAQYSEQKVASHMRAVLRTVAQCHSHSILHRDVKPGNFMLLNDSPNAPVKAIDFGLAVFFDPEQLPRTDLGLEGTPWYMAPEVLSCAVMPASDVWAAGVMAYLLLCGRLPFNDHQNPEEPALSLIWRSIFADEPKLSGSAWKDISEDAKSFVKLLLEKDPAVRPGAREALQHPWLQGHPGAQDASKPINQAIVQRLQRFGQGNALRKSIFEMIAAELIKALPPLETSPANSAGCSIHGSGHGLSLVRSLLLGQSPGQSRQEPITSSAIPAERPAAAPTCSWRPSFRRPSSAGSGTDITMADAAHESSSQFTILGTEGCQSSLGQVAPTCSSAHAGSFEGAGMERVPSANLTGGRTRSLHDGNHFRLLRQVAAAGLAAPQGAAGAEEEYWHVAPRTDEERREQQKAARLALGSCIRDPAFERGGSESKDASESVTLLGASTERRNTSEVSKSHYNKWASVPQMSKEQYPESNMGDESAISEGEMGGRRGKLGLYNRWLIEASTSNAPCTASQQQQQLGKLEGGAGLRKPLLPTAMVSSAPVYEAAVGGASPMECEAPRSRRSLERRVCFNTTEKAVEEDVVARQRSLEACPPSLEFPSGIREIMRKLKFSPEEEGVAASQLTEGLNRLGYQLEPCEAERLLDPITLDGNGVILKSEFLASQIDWDSFQVDYREQWLQAARRAFEELDNAGAGVLRSEQLLGLLRQKLPAPEVEYAVENALLQGGHADADEIDFDAFLHLLRVPLSSDHLDQYESRHRASHSHHGGTVYSDQPSDLKLVSEEAPVRC